MLLDVIDNPPYNNLIVMSDFNERTEATHDVADISIIKTHIRKDCHILHIRVPGKTYKELLAPKR